MYAANVNLGSTQVGYTLHFVKTNLGSTQVEPTSEEGLAWPRLNPGGQRLHYKFLTQVNVNPGST